jgi:murein hydrolase activator
VRERRLALGLAGLTLALAVVAGVGMARGDTKIVEREGELRTLKGQIEEKRRQIESLRRRGQDLERIVAELEHERGMTERYLEALRQQETALEQDLTTRKLDLDAKEVQVGEVRRELGTALVQYYKQRRVTDAELLISSASFSELFARAQYWARTVQNLRQRLYEVQATGEAIERDLAQIGQQRAEMLAIRAEREEQMRTLMAQETTRRSDREKLDRTVADYEAQTRKLLAAQKKVEEVIRAAQRSGAPAAGAGLTARRARLPWPVRGEIVTRFGTQVHPRYGTRVQQKGIEIAAAEGTPVRAVAGGRVVYTGWLEGYGKTVVLDHGANFFTLYAHASEILVGLGDTVKEGSEIARVGATDAMKGPGLYFEIRQGPEAVDPAEWLE